MRSKSVPPGTESGRLLPFAAAAGLLLALIFLARGAALGLAVFLAGPVPAVQTAFSLAREKWGQALSAPSAQQGSPDADTAPSADATPSGAAGTVELENYLVELQGEDACPADAGTVLEKTYPQGSGEKYVPCGTGSIKNNTSVSSAEIAAEIQNPLPFAIERYSTEPQVLIMHTHATEDYRMSAGLWFDPADGSRSTDRAVNMCAVGRVMADTLNAAGICTLQDETLNDYPSYTGSYSNSRAVVQQYLAQYPSIKVVLDVHRDAIETEGGSRMAPVCTVNGRQAAQVMIICGCDNGSTVKLPDWRQNLRFAAAWEQAMEGMYPGFTRPVLFSYRFYNQDLTTGSLLIEIGGHGNNLNEALYAGQLAANALVQVLTGG
ncbi:MAG: stage II sporulation protein P [Faecalibacterium sp.]